MRKSICFLAAFLLFAILPLHAQQNDFSKVQIKVQKVSGTVYMLEGAGGNIGASVGDDGIVIVDDEFLPLAEKIEAALIIFPYSKVKQIRRVREERLAATVEARSRSRKQPSISHRRRPLCTQISYCSWRIIGDSQTTFSTNPVSIQGHKGTKSS